MGDLTWLDACSGLGFQPDLGCFCFLSDLAVIFPVVGRFSVMAVFSVSRRFFPLFCLFSALFGRRFFWFCFSSCFLRFFPLVLVSFSVVLFFFRVLFLVPWFCFLI